ncbi:MAG: hypothetical protein IJ608_02820 [Lachnospiraceae bacterium]|nr:hypothetical protein [Lachnospiraceae bacterium]
MIHYAVDMDDLTRIESALGMLKDKTPMSLRTAINRTATETQKLLLDEASGRYYFKRSEAKKTMSIKKATTRNLEAIVYSQGAPLELYGAKVLPKAYNPKNRPKAGHKGNVKKSNSAKYLYLKSSGKDRYKAFVVKYKNGHISIAQRRPGTSMRGNIHKEAIKNLYTTSIPAMLGYEQGIYGIVKPQIESMLIKNIQAQASRYLS